MKHKKIKKYTNRKLFKPPKNQNSAQYLLEILKKDYQSYNVDYYRDLLLKYQKEIDKIKKILIQGYFEDLLDSNIDDFEIISRGIKMWDNEIIRLKTEENPSKN